MPTPFPELETYLPGARQPRKPSTSNAPSTWLDREMERQRDDQIRDGLLSAPAPDAVARTEKIARDTGSSILDVQGNEDAAERGLQVRRMVDIASQYPAVGKWAAKNPRGAAMAVDDHESLSVLGQAWDFVSKVPSRVFHSGLPLAGQGVAATWNRIVDINELAQSPINAGMSSLAQATGWSILDPEGALNASVRQRQAISDAWGDRAEAGSNRVRGATAITEGLLQGVDSIPLTAIALATRNPELGSTAIGVMTGSTSYESAKAKGLSTASAIPYAFAQGTTEALTEKIPIGILGEMITRKMPWGKAFLRELGQEMTGEQIATFTQDLTDWAYLPENRNKTFGDFLLERPEAAGQTALAVLGGSGTTSLVIGAAHRATDATASVTGRVREAKQARAERAALEEMAKGSEASKLKQRDPEAFRTLMREHAEEAGASSVFIPGEAIRSFNQSEGYDPANDPFASSDAQEAAATGGDVVMPIEDFLTDVVGTPAWEAIKDDVRLSQGGMSFREAQTFDEAMAEVMSQTADEMAATERADRTARSTRDQLVDRVAAMFGEGYTAPVARQYAEIAVQRAQTRAQRLGMELSPQDFDNFAVRQVLPEGVAQAVAADRLDLVINALRTGGPLEYGVGPSLLEFIQQRGGINDVGGDLASMGVPQKYLREYDPRQVEMAGGVSGNGDFGIDNTLRAAIEAGYFPDLVNVENEQGPSTLDTQRLLDALAEEMAGRPAFAETRTDDVRASAEDLRQMLEHAGYSPSEMTDQDIRDTVERLAKEVDILGRAYEQSNDVGPFGPRFEQFRGDAQGAVEFLRTVQDGEAVGALHHPDIGDIDLPWGVEGKNEHDGYGLAKLIRWHPEVVGDLQGILSSLAVTSRTANRVQLESADHKAAVRLAWDDQAKNWLLTAFRKVEDGAAATSTDTGRDSSEVARSEDAVDRSVAKTIRDFQQETRGRVIFDENKRVIELFKGRDLSTPIHELGHVWLEELAADAALPSAPEQLRADWDAVKSWFAHSGHAIAQDGTIPVEAHELFARGIERYFMEGKAPTNALTRIFENVRQWMLSIYRSVSALRSEISPEIREVFDRMIASDEEIAAARERQGIDALFKQAADAGMSKAEFAAYQAKAEDANAAAHAKLLERVMSTIRRRETERYREARRGVREEEAARIDASPIFRALAAMEVKKDGNRISKEWIVDRMGLDALDLLPRRVPPLYVEGGVNPENVAEVSGYASATEMIEALIGAERAHRQAKEGGDQRSMRERAIETATDQEMARRYGDPLNDGSIEREAMEAVQSEMLGEVISSEIRALGRKTGRGPLPYQIARDWARGKVRSGKWIDVASPGALVRHARNAAKAGKAAEAALLAGDHAEAYRQKQFQMLNNALAAEAYVAADEVETARKRMEKVAEAKTRKAIDQDYLEQAQMLLEAVDLKRRSQIYERRKGSFAAWAAAREAEGFDVVVPETFEATLGLTNWSKMPVEDILMLDEAVKQIMHLGRRKQMLIDGQDERLWEEIEQEAVASAENLRGKPPADLADPRLWESIGRGIAGIDATLLKMETVFDWLDDGNPNGVFNRIAFRPIARAQAREADMLKDYLGRIKAHFEEVPPEVASRWQDRIVLPFIDIETGRNMVLNRQQLVAMALNVGNEGNLQRLADGYRLNGGALIGYLDETLTKEEWQFVQNVWDTFDALWPESSAMEKRVNGVVQNKVRARKFDTSTNGQMRGGYYPAVYNTSRNYKAQENAGKESDLLDSRYSRSNTNASSSKARSEQVEMPILLNLGVINRHLGEVIHDITHREAVIQVNRFLTSERVRRAVDAALGQEIGKQFRPWIKFVANSWAVERAGNEGFGKWLGKLRANTTAVGMGLRATTMVSQIAGYSNSFEVVGEAAMAKAIAQFYRDIPGHARAVMERSDELRHRMNTIDRDIRTEIARLSRINPANKAAAAVIDGRKFFFHGIGYMDLAVSIPTWMAGYSNALAAGMSEEDAAYAADKAVRQSQGAGGPKDLAAIQRGTGTRGEALKLMTMFYSFFSAQYQRERTLARDAMGVDRRRERNVPKLAARAFFLLVLPPLLTEVLRAAVGAHAGPDDDEWWTQWVARKLLANAIGPIPGVRDVFEPAWNAARGARYFAPSISPVSRAFESFVKAVGSVAKEASGGDAPHTTKDVLEAAGYLTGLVPGQVASATQFLLDVGNGDTTPQDFGDWLEGLSTGKIDEKR
ncbi:hypothetical protein [Novosphingobium sp. PY1]|uniref:Large polyvalent protein associated domain-containing protein n=1 Tax=Ochrobactrum sp. PW1 TaxID=1882222 RepID=A0A292GNH7_9HYPH|nr:hypothetical protein [Novosphingobium sp. PY1]BBA74428.1 hypothetical protein [Ochrobactrum sp. PW1]GFM29277.1 uncharacterized protein PY1_contig-07-203 [Novosphingobium sp. PY1]